MEGVRYRGIGFVGSRECEEAMLLIELIQRTDLILPHGIHLLAYPVGTDLFPLES